MIDAIDNGLLTTDLDGNDLEIINLGAVIPTPTNLVDTFDPRLSNARIPIDGSVTNTSVSPTAAIEQSKLDLNGEIPQSWLGTDDIHAAPGDRVEYLSNKGVPGGYAGLDGTGKVPAGQLPSSIG